ncbi:competence type IV pilus major pilin ComGC [Dolosicoccus paucivorans]|uniref:competence type IV pilus major pilin ComGC n=1 Tax=Dolosicoccus paucivorans TaxID=84521 RepID=UPI0008894272|nr:competence type IV pilus major pilin ComGC [Dolosicoccus paucivorans]SDI23698.1 competence protein ComGC [Dolosicoccus paucivorans]
MKKLRQLLKKIKNKKGFTLLEMLIVLVIVALLMAIIIPQVSGQKKRIEQQAKENIAEVVTTQVETYQMVEASSDVTLQTLHDGGYITDRQLQTAGDLLSLDPNTTISLPISVDE